MTHDEFQSYVDGFLPTLGDHWDEFWTSERSFAEDIFTQFVNWFWAEDLEKEKRYAQFLELKKEFEND